MKQMLLCALAFLSLNAFSQSYLVLENGITITVDKAGYVYDFGHYTPTHSVTIKGGQYLVEDMNVLVTIDEQGLLYRKYEILPSSLKGKGMNYFIDENGWIYLIDGQGFVHIIEDDAKLANATKFGGNFFVVNAEELYTVNSFGEYSAVKVEGLNPADILTFGGSYFMTNRGLLYTVSENGNVTAKPEDRVGIIVKKGGNYFIDTTGTIYTITKDGDLIIPDIPMNLRLNTISKLGANYFIDVTGNLYTVDQDGKIFERSLDYDLRTTKIISL